LALTFFGCFAYPKKAQPKKMKKAWEFKSGFLRSKKKRQ